MANTGVTMATIRRGYVCPSCRLAATAQTRTISTSFLRRKKEGRDQWARQAEEIRAGKRISTLDLMERRGFVHQITGERDAFSDLLTDKRVGIYCGIDPTAPSLHVGHLLPLMCLFWFHILGYHTISLIGGSTAGVGDPTGRSTDRPKMSGTEKKANIVGQHYQLKRMWANLEATGARHGFVYDKNWQRGINNNAVWWNKLPMMEVLRLMGPGLRLGEMLKRDTVRTKMESGAGMSFSEFCYPIMQAWDWWHQYNAQDIQVQIGGADQFGNIVAGVDAIKYIAKNHPHPDINQPEGVTPQTTPYGMTVPLLTTSTGAKFGKSAGNAIWLDSNMTEHFDLYAFFVKTSDDDIERFLKLFTFMPLEVIEKLMTNHRENTSKQLAQKALAYEVLYLVHGAENADRARDKYENMSASRKTMTLSSLFSASDLQTRGEALPDDAAENQQTDEALAPHFTRDPLAPPPNPDNPFTSHEAKFLQEKGSWINKKLNRFAPSADGNNSAGKLLHVVLPYSLIKDQSIAKVLFSAGLVGSRSEGTRLAQARGAYVGRQASGQMTEELHFLPIQPQDPHTTWNNVIRDDAVGDKMEREGEEGLLVLRAGKWKLRVVRIVTDAKFESLKLPDPPGWTERKAVMAAERARDDEDAAGPLPQPGHTLGETEDADFAEDEAGREEPMEADPDDEPFVEPTQWFNRRAKNAARLEQERAALEVIDKRLRRESASMGRRLPEKRSAVDARLAVREATDFQRQYRSLPWTYGEKKPPPKPNGRMFPWESEPRPKFHPEPKERPTRDIWRSDNESRDAEPESRSSEVRFDARNAEPGRYSWNESRPASQTISSRGASTRQMGNPRDTFVKRKRLSGDAKEKLKAAKREATRQAWEERTTEVQRESIKMRRKELEWERKRLIKEWKGEKTKFTEAKKK